MPVPSPEISAWSILVGVWVVIGVVVIVALVKAWPIISGAVSAINAIAGLPGFIDTTTESLASAQARLSDFDDKWERIRRQVENDHQTNLRDELTELLDQLREAREEIARLATWTERHETLSDGYRERIKTLEAALAAEEES